MKNIKILKNTKYKQTFKFKSKNIAKFKQKSPEIKFRGCIK